MSRGLKARLGSQTSRTPFRGSNLGQPVRAATAQRWPAGRQPQLSSLTWRSARPACCVPHTQLAGKELSSLNVGKLHSLGEARALLVVRLAARLQVVQALRARLAVGAGQHLQHSGREVRAVASSLLQPSQGMDCAAAGLQRTPWAMWANGKHLGGRGWPLSTALPSDLQ